MTKSQIGQKTFTRLIGKPKASVFVKHSKRHSAGFGQLALCILHALTLKPFERLLASGCSGANQTAAGTNRRQYAVNFIGNVEARDIPDDSLAAGCPAVVKRKLNGDGENAVATGMDGK